MARRLAHADPRVRVVHLDEKGRGRALRAVWSTSESPVLAYMDVDLSTDLAALLPMLASLVSGHSDVAIGSRLSPSSRVARGPKRELISRCYNLILRSVLRARFRDAQCGFKAIRREVALDLLPQVKDQTWFFDTELLVLAERAGLRIHEVPVDWVDDPDSRVDIWRTAIDDLRGVLRLRREIGVFATVGVASTVAYGLLYLVLRSALPTYAANATALLLTAIANTAANRRFTFGVQGPRDLLRHHSQGFVVFALGLGLTTGALWLLHASGVHGGLPELVVLTVANLAVTVMRFVLLKVWVFGVKEGAASPSYG